MCKAYSVPLFLKILFYLIHIRSNPCIYILIVIVIVKSAYHLAELLLAIYEIL